MDNQIENTKQDRRKERLEAYMRFFETASKKGVTPYNISKNTGIATSTLSDWKKGDSMPKRDKIEKICDYLDTPIDYIINGHVVKIQKTGQNHAEVLKMYSMLSEAEQEQIKNMMEFFIKNRK